MSLLQSLKKKLFSSKKKTLVQSQKNNKNQSTTKTGEATLANIQNSLQTIASLKELIFDGLEIVKGGVTLGDLPKIFECMNDLKDLASAGQKALPELKDLDAGEIGQLTAAAYSLVTDLVKKINS